MVRVSDFEGVGEQILKIAERQKADEAEAYLVSNKVLTVRLVNNSVFEAKGVHDIGVGIRVLRDGGLGFSSTADFTSKSIRKAVKAALDASKTRKLPFKYSFPSPAKPPKVRGVYDTKLAKLPSDEAVDSAFQMVEESLAYNRKIADNAGVFNLVVYHTLVMNSHGLKAGDEGTFFEASLTATARQGARSSEGAESTAGRSLKELKPKEIGRKAAEMAVSGLKAKPLREGNYPVILDPEPAFDIEDYVSSLCSPMIAKLYYPLFLDKLGKKVGSEELTVVDDPLMPNGVGSAPIDDEGVPSQTVTVMEKGLLKSFLYDTFYGAMEKKRPTASGVRKPFAVVGVSRFPGKNFNGEPIPVPRNPYIVPGHWKREEMIEDTKDGLLVKRFHYTRLTNPTRGDFTSVLRMGLYGVKKGEVVGALKKSRLIDNLLDILKNVDAVSDTLTVAGAWGDYAHTPVIRTKAHVAPV
ncbi:MAG: TldD/PmbA family protein [Candidatus Bathyarchaeia archaeon]